MRNFILVMLLIISAWVFMRVFRYAWRKWDYAKRSGLRHKFPHRAAGVVFGKDRLRLVCSPETSEGSIAIFGGSGSGKSAGIIIPTLRAWSGTAFVIDISGDIEKNVPDASKVVYAPENSATLPYNVFAAVDACADIEEQNELLQQLVLSLIPKEAQDGDVTIFYKGEARKLLQSAFLAYYHAGLDFIPICQQIVDCGYEVLLADINASENELAKRLIAAFEGGNERTLAGIKQEADNAIMLFATNEKVGRTLRRPALGECSIFPETLETKSVYIIIDDVKLELYAPLLRLITCQTLEYLSGRENFKNPPILLALDEFSSLGKLDIKPALQKLRKRNVRIMICTQSLLDLDLIYGSNERKAMLDNCPYKVVLSASDTDTQKYFSDLAGEQTVYRATTTTSAYDVSESLTV